MNLVEHRLRASKNFRYICLPLLSPTGSLSSGPRHANGAPIVVTSYTLDYEAR